MNYYETLEVSPNASQAVIKAAYKSLMQRYHPDKNPGDTAIAERAVLVGQAYEVLSDAAKRAVYDNQFKRHLTDQANNDGETRPLAAAPPVKDGKFYWFVWLLIVATIFSSFLVLTFLKKKQPPESGLSDIRSLSEGKQLTQKQLQAELNHQNELLRQQKMTGEREKAEAARITPVFIKDLTVYLSDASESSMGAVYILRIPILGTKVGAVDAEKVMRHIDSDKALIRLKIEEKLAFAKYEEVIKDDGEEYLKKLILDSIGNTIKMDRFKDYPSSNSEEPERYGVVEVFLPKSFFVSPLDKKI